jgi:uncharacterized RDD family membrane protein YckC
MLLAGGMSDPASIAVALGSAACFLLLMASGALRAEAGSMRLRELLVDRPFYLLGVLAVFIAVGATASSAAKLGLLLFSSIYLVALGMAAHALRQHLKARGLGVYASRGDQLYILLGAIAVPAALVVLDAMSSNPVGGPSSMVAVFNVLNLLYPPLLMVASRPFREPLRLRLVRPRPTVPAVVAEDAVAA